MNQIEHSFAVFFLNLLLVVSSPPTEERGEPSEGLLYRQQESHLCQQMKLATVSQGQEPAAGWFQEETATCSTTQPHPGLNQEQKRQLMSALTNSHFISSFDFKLSLQYT